MDAPNLTESQQRAIERVQVVGVSLLIALVVGVPLARTLGYFDKWSAAGVGLTLGVLLLGATSVAVARIEGVRARDLSPSVDCVSRRHEELAELSVLRPSARLTTVGLISA